MANTVAATEDPLRPDFEPGEDDGGGDDELEALRLAALNSIRPKEKTEPAVFELNLRNQAEVTEERDCPLYAGGFCRRGPACWLRHVPRILCLNYIAGFCPEGPACLHAHPKLEVPVHDGSDEKESAQSDHTRTTTPDDSLTEHNQNLKDISRHRSRSRSSSRSGSRFCRRVLHSAGVLHSADPGFRSLEKRRDPDHRCRRRFRSCSCSKSRSPSPPRRHKRYRIGEPDKDISIYRGRWRRSRSISENSASSCWVEGAQFEIYIGNFPVRFDEKDLRDLFEEHNIDIGVIRMKQKRAKVFAFAETTSADEIEKAVRALDSKEINGRRLIVRDSRRGRKDRSSSGEWTKDNEQSPPRTDNDSGSAKFSLSDEESMTIRNKVLKECVRLHLAFNYSTRSTQCRLCKEIFPARVSFKLHPCTLSLMSRISATIETFIGESNGTLKLKEDDV